MFYGIYMQKGSVLYLCTKFQVDSSFSSKVIIGGPKISTLGHMTPATST